MSKVKCLISVSADGFVAGPNQSEEHPLGEGGEALHEWAFKTAYFQEIHGREGGEAGVSDEVLRAVELAREAAGGGGETIQQLIRAGLLDELLVNQVPVILGGGTRLLEDIPSDVELEQTRVVEAPGVAHIFYRVNKETD